MDDDNYYLLSKFDDGHVMSDPLSVIKSLVIDGKGGVIGGWVSYDSEGYLEGEEALVLLIKVSLPSRSPFRLLQYEKIAICWSDSERKFRAYAIRKSFPDLPHLYLVPKDKPRPICLFDVPFMDEMYNQTFMDFIVRIKKWLDRAAVGELHLDEQHMEPFLFGTDGCLVLDIDTYEKIKKGTSHIELFTKYLLEPGEWTDRYYIEVGSKKVKLEESKNAFALMLIKSEPSGDQCISHRPDDYQSLYELLNKKLLINLDAEILKYISDYYKRPEGKKIIEKMLIVMICIPRINLKGEMTIPEIIVFYINSKLKDIALSIGCLVEKNGKGGNKTSYVIRNDFVRNEERLKKIKVYPLQVIRPFTKKLALDMAGASEELTNTSISVIGQGALGSQLVLNLARQGFFEWTLYDGDMLLPHNFARHGASSIYRGFIKSRAIEHEIKSIYDKAKIKSRGVFVPGVELNSNILLDCSASYGVFLDIAYRIKSNPRNISVYCCGEGYVSVFICEDIERKIRLDDIDLQLKVNGISDSLINNIYLISEEKPVVYSTSCNSATSIVPQDLIGIHSGILARQFKSSIKDSGARVFVNVIEKNEFGVEVGAFIPSSVFIAKSNDWEFRISADALNEMTRLRDDKLPNETGGVLIGWINSFYKIIYVGMVLPAPSDSIERPYYFQRGKAGLFNLVNDISKISNGDLGYVGEWHSHPPKASSQKSKDDEQCMNIIARFMRVDSLPGVLIIICDSNETGCYVSLGW